MIIPLGILGQFYFMSMIVGGAFIAINLVMGNLGDGADGDGGGGHSGDGTDASSTSGDDFGAADGTNGQSPDGDDFGAANSSKLITTNLARTNVVAGLHHRAMTTHSGDKTAPVMPRLPRKIGSLILSMLSPMSLALFLAFFGVFGLACASIGYASILPACIGSMAVSKLFKSIIRYLIVNGNVSTAGRIADVVGQIGEVNTPISNGRPGEITYTLGSKRYSSAAKPSKIGVEFKRGSKVWITEVQGHILLVDACDEADAHLLQG